MEAFVEFENNRFAIGYFGRRRKLAVVVVSPSGTARIFLPNVSLRKLGKDPYELGQDAMQPIVEEKGKFYAVYPAEKTGKHRALIFVDGCKPVEKTFTVGRYEVKPSIDRYF